MQKWYPESFSNEGPLTTAQESQADFESLAPSPEEEEVNSQSLEVQFRSESGFLDSDQLMKSLTREERSQVFDLVEQDVRVEFNAKSLELEADCQKKIQEAQTNFDQSLITWAENFNRITELELKKASAGAARLSVLLAEKIVRCQVSLDSAVLERALETSMFKIHSTTGVSVTLNPDDAKSINENTKLLSNLNITSVESDRRIQNGGCMVKSADMEWDVTVASQLSSLAELVEEMISTSNGIKLPSPNSGEKVDPNDVE